MMGLMGLQEEEETQGFSLSHVRIQQKDGCLHLDPGLINSITGRNKCWFLKPPSLWHVAIAAQTDGDIRTCFIFCYEF